MSNPFRTRTVKSPHRRHPRRVAEAPTEHRVPQDIVLALRPMPRMRYYG